MGGEYSASTTLKPDAYGTWTQGRIDDMTYQMNYYNMFADLPFDDESSPSPAVPSVSTYFSNLPDFWYFADQGQHEANFVLTYPPSLGAGSWYHAIAYYSVQNPPASESWINVSGYSLDGTAWGAYGREWLAKLKYRGYGSELTGEGLGCSKGLIAGGAPTSAGGVADATSPRDLILVLPPQNMGDLVRYAEQSRAKIGELVQAGQDHISVVVTFREPVPLSKAADLVERVGLSVTSYQLRGYVNGGGTPEDRYTAGAAPDDGVLFPEARLAALRDDLVRVGGKEFAGVVSIVGVVPGSTADDLISDPAVFLVDPSGTAFRAEGDAVGSDVGEVAVHSPYWFVETAVLSEGQ